MGAEGKIRDSSAHGSFLPYPSHYGFYSLIVLTNIYEGFVCVPETLLEAEKISMTISKNAPVLRAGMFLWLGGKRIDNK